VFAERRTRQPNLNDVVSNNRLTHTARRTPHTDCTAAAASSDVTRTLRQSQLCAVSRRSLTGRLVRRAGKLLQGATSVYFRPIGLDVTLSPYIWL